MQMSPAIVADTASEHKASIGINCVDLVLLA